MTNVSVELIGLNCPETMPARNLAVKGWLIFIGFWWVKGGMPDARK